MSLLLLHQFFFKCPSAPITLAFILSPGRTLCELSQTHCTLGFYLYFCTLSRNLMPYIHLVIQQIFIYSTPIMCQALS